LRGYRAFEQDCGPYYPKIKPSLEIQKVYTPKSDPVSRYPPIAASLGCHIVGAVPPISSHDPISAGSGAIKRIGTEPGKLPRKIKRKFARFVKLFLKRWIPKIQKCDDVTFEEWVMNAPYSLSRKEELIGVWKENQHYLSGDYELNPKTKKHVLRVKNFIKWEFYEPYKHARMINSRTDFFKCLVGPIFKMISNNVFGLKYPGKNYGPLIKNVPVAERPLALYDLLYTAGGDYQVTDYSSFEAHFTAELMEICEFQLYGWSVSELPSGDAFMNLVRESMATTNTIYNKNFKMSIAATRMSGEMNTSLGNGFSNLMIALFLSNQTHLRNGFKGTMESWIDEYHVHARGAVEGDDGLFSFDDDAKPTTSDFTEFGAIIKLENVEQISEASFCGNVFDPVDMVQITDPAPILAAIGWTSQKYLFAKTSTKNALLRCKANSFLHQYPGCPIVQELATWLLRVVPLDEKKENTMIDQMDQWNQEQALQAKKAKLRPKKVPIRTRHLVEKLYNIPIDEQVVIERWFARQSKLCPIDCPTVLNIMPDSWKDMYSNHVMQYYDDHSIFSLNEKELARLYVGNMSKFVPSMVKLAELVV